MPWQDENRGSLEAFEKVFPNPRSLQGYAATKNKLQ
jgi:hypothetical protein